MNLTIFDVLKADKELKKLKEEAHALTGIWPAFNFEEFADIEEFKESIRKDIALAKEKKEVNKVGEK